MMRRHLVPLCLLALCASGGAWAQGDAEQSFPAAGGPDLPAAERFEGTIADLVVDDRVDARLLHFPRLQQADGTSIGLLGGPFVSLLRTGDGVVLTGRRNGSALDVTAIESRLAASAPVEKRLAQRVSGRLELLHSDDFERGIGRFRYHVRADDDRITELAIDALPAVLRGGMRVEVEGRDAGSAGLMPAEITILAAAPDDPTAGKAVTAKSVSLHSVLVIMANFNNTAAPSFTAAQAQQVMTSNAASVANYYNEASYGQHQLNVAVTSTWLTLAYAKPTCVDSDLNGFTNAANSAATAAGYAVSSYEFVVYLFPPLSCGWSGLGYIGLPKHAYINGPGSFATGVVGHEMGHNFGLLHAGSLRCTGAIGGACSVAEYGDPFDMMGNQHASHFNAMQKSLLGWIGAATTPTHNGGTVTYTLSPIETGGGATYAVKIPTPQSTRTYWLEYRQPIGFDAWSGWVSNGVQIRVASPFETYCSGCNGYSDDTELVDATPGTSSFTDAALTVGNMFSDPNYPVSVNVLSASASALTVQVVTPAVVGSTTTALASSLNPAPVGASVTFTATVSGNAPTGTVSFKDDVSTIAGCAAVALGGSGSSRSAACSTATLTAGTHSITAAYSGDGANMGSTSAVLSESVNSSGWLGYLNGGNVASGSGSAVAAGSSNVASGQGSFVGAGQANSADGVSSLVIGGFDNHATAIDSMVGAGAGNRATGARSVVAGGGYNLASGNWSFIGAGGRETGSGVAGAAPEDNVAMAKWSTILGGSGNRAGSVATQTGPTVIGGEANQALNADATVAGGTGNVASATYATVLGGQSNTASASGSVVSGGTDNTSSATSAAIFGGSTVVASGSYGVAAGRRARATLAGSLTFADGSNFDFTSSAANQFSARATGGMRIVSAIDGTGAPTAGVALAAGSGSWSSLSDRAAKTSLSAVDTHAVLASVMRMPMYTWRYRAETSAALHMGPTAQDFHAAFGLGNTDKGIAMVDGDGVALGAIKALQAEVTRNEHAIAERARRIAVLRARVEGLQKMRAELDMLDATLKTLLNDAGDPSATVRAIHH